MVKNLNFKSYGFTLMELLVVVSIMVVLTTVLTLNLAGQRAARDIKIAQNQLISDIRKVQSYTLSARSLPGGESAEYYVLKFDLANPSQYAIQAISNASSQPMLQDIETIHLPPNIQIGGLTTGDYPVSISRPSSPSPQVFSAGCALAAFAAPFGKIILNDGCDPVNSSTNPMLLTITDDYYGNIVNFQGNLNCPSYPPPAPFAVCKASTDSIMTVTLTDTARTLSKKVLINAITGVVCPTTNGSTCQAVN